MADHGNTSAAPQLTVDTNVAGDGNESHAVPSKDPWWKIGKREKKGVQRTPDDSDNDEKNETPPERWSLGILNDRKTEEVPGTVLLLSSNRNEPLGLQHAPRNTSASSLPSPYPSRSPSRRSVSLPREKKTADGQILLVPQPDDSLNDPLNWPAWRRDLALLSLGFYCMLGGGITPILAAGYENVADNFHISEQRVALTTGLYMMGLGIGSVIFAPTAILFGKRPVYLGSVILFILSDVWCAKSPNFANLAVARIFQGISVSPVECLPSATIAEIFFLHERAFRIGIYTLLLLSGKNLIPLISAAVIQALSWRWVFWVVAIVAAFGGCLLFVFVPETFWDRTPRPKVKSKRPGMGHRSLSNILHHTRSQPKICADNALQPKGEVVMTPRQRRLHQQNFHVGFADADEIQVDGSSERPKLQLSNLPTPEQHRFASRVAPSHDAPDTPELHSLNSPYYLTIEPNDYLSHHSTADQGNLHDVPSSALREKPSVIPERSQETLPSPTPRSMRDPEKAIPEKAAEEEPAHRTPQRYTHELRQAPPKTFVQTLRPFNGRISHANWLIVAFRPFVLYSYPTLLWSSIVYACSIGWMIVLSESVSTIYRSKDAYDFTALQVGLVYISPFIGGILGTAVAGRVSDVIVRYMCRRNDGVYEPEFRLVMAIPILISTSIGLMGFGWSAQAHDPWIAPTIFFGIISFGCSVGATTSITFAVDSYRQYAGEALVTLNFFKNICHGLVWSLFFPDWLKADGSRTVFLAIGGIQIAACLASVPMYIYGKRARMWTVRKGFMEKFS